MTDTEMKANLYSLEKRIYQLEQKMAHMADVGDMKLNGIYMVMCMKQEALKLYAY